VRQTARALLPRSRASCTAPCWSAARAPLTSLIANSGKTRSRASYLFFRCQRLDEFMSEPAQGQGAGKGIVWWHLFRTSRVWGFQQNVEFPARVDELRPAFGRRPAIEIVFGLQIFPDRRAHDFAASPVASCLLQETFDHVRLERLL